MRIYNERIPKNRMMQFHDILCSTGGRYINNPIEFDDIVLCNYEPGDYQAQMSAWRRITNDIKEVRKDQWYRKLLRRIGI